MQISQQGDAKEVSEVNQLKNAKSLVQETKEDEVQRWEDLQTVVYSHRNKFCQHVHLTLEISQKLRGDQNYRMDVLSNFCHDQKCKLLCRGVIGW